MVGSYRNAEQYTRNVGFSTHNETFVDMFSDSTVSWISSEISRLLEGVGPNGANIVVTDDVILGVLNAVYIAYRPQVGDIYSRYNIRQFEPRDDANHIITQTIEIIVDQISSEYGMIEHNRTLSIWDSVLMGDGISRRGLRRHSPIKLRENRPTPMLFNYSF